VSSAAVLIVWLLYLHKIDVFEPERWLYLCATAAGGAILSPVAIWGYDLVDSAFGLQLGSGHLDDLVYGILAIGPIEETLKIIPPLLILRFTEGISETTDYVIYGAASALGFAFVENLSYLSGDGATGIMGRMMSSVLLHMFLTSFIMYGLVGFVYENMYSPFISFARKFAAACVLHGIYDFGIIDRNFLSGALGQLSIAIVVFAIIALARMLKNTLNKSGRFKPTYGTIIDNTDLLVRWLGGILILQYSLVALAHGPSAANRDLLKQLFLNWFLLFCVLAFLGKLTLSRNHVEELFDS